MTPTVRRPRDADELAAALALRIEVFCGEQGVTFERGTGVRAALLSEAEHEGIDHLGMETYL